jgi:hypothetical protein
MKAVHMIWLSIQDWHPEIIKESDEIFRLVLGVIKWSTDIRVDLSRLTLSLEVERARNTVWQKCRPYIHLNLGHCGRY